MADVTVDRGKVRTSTSRDNPLELDLGTLHPLVSWRAIVAGFLVTFLCLAILLSLGMAFGGISINQNDVSAQGVGVFSGVWFLVSTIIALFVGSYFAARISKFHTNRVGSAQGLVIASLFFALFLWQTFSAIGWIGSTAGSAIGSTAKVVGQGASQASQNPAVQDVVQKALGDLNLRTDPRTVVSGVASRLLQGDTQGAKTYLSEQTGISPQEADARINQLQAQVSQAATQARETAGQTLQGVGWSLFATMILGAAAAIGGGALGSRANLRKPLSLEQLEGAQQGIPIRV